VGIINPFSLRDTVCPECNRRLGDTLADLLGGRFTFPSADPGGERDTIKFTVPHSYQTARHEWYRTLDRWQAPWNHETDHNRASAFYGDAVVALLVAGDNKITRRLFATGRTVDLAGRIEARKTQLDETRRLLTVASCPADLNAIIEICDACITTEDDDRTRYEYETIRTEALRRLG